MEEKESLAKNQLMNLIGDARGVRGPLGKVTWVRKRPSVVVDYEAAFQALWSFASEHALFKPEDARPTEFLKQYTSERASSPYLLATPKKGEQ